MEGIGWTDLGTWGSLYDTSPKTREGNVTHGTKTMMMNSRNNIVSAPSHKLVIASQLNDYIIADSDNALLIVPRSEEQKIRNYVREVKTTLDREQTKGTVLSVYFQCVETLVFVSKHAEGMSLR